MGHGEHGDHVVVGGDGHPAVAEVYHRAHVATGQHDTLGVACRAGGIVDDGQLVHVVGGVIDVGGAEAVGIFGCESLFHAVVSSLHGVIGCIEQVPFLDVHRKAQARHRSGIHLGPLGSRGEQADALGVVHKVADAVGGEIEQDGYGYRTIGIYGQEHHAPAGAVVGADRHLVVLGIDAGGLHEDAELLDAGGHVTKAVALATYVVQGLLVPEFADRILQTGNVVRVLCNHVSNISYCVV